MPLVRRSFPSRIDARMCLSCGYRGEELQSPIGDIVRCPECGEDLYSRPPRSYAELEGFADPEDPPAVRTPGPVRTLLGRWLLRWAAWWRRPRR